MVRFGLAILLAISAAACSGNSPTSPSTNNTPSTPAPQLYTITGVVREAGGGPGLGGATVRVVDGPNAGQSVTADGSGNYTLGNLPFLGFQIEASAPNYEPLSRGGFLTQGQFTTTVNWNLRPLVPWSLTGRGNTVLDIPGWVNRVRIIGTTTSRCQNFIVSPVGRASMVNAIIGTCSIADGAGYDGIHLVTGRTIEIESSEGVDWTFIEVR